MIRKFSNARSLAGLVGVLVVGTSMAACGDDGAAPTPGGTSNDAAVDAGEAGSEASPDAADEASDASGDAPVEASGDGAGDAQQEAEAASDDYTVWVGAGFATACALSQKGRVKCWGDNVEAEMLIAPVQGAKCFQFGETTPTIDCDPRAPTELVLPFPVIELSVGYLNACAIFDDAGTRKLGCWGNNQRNELTTAAAVNSTIVWIDLPAQPKHLGAGKNFKLAWLDDATIWGWGDNRFGQYGAAVLGENAVPSKVFPFVPAADPDAGTDAGDPDAAVDTGTVLDFATAAYNTFVLTSNGLYGVGDNTTSEVMLPTTVEEYHSFVKLPVPAGTSMASLHDGCARAHGQCYITTQGRAFCWGDNDTGQISNLLPDPQEAPSEIALAAGATVTQLSQGAGQVCAVLGDGTVYCWGSNRRAECGLAACQDPVVPNLVPGLSNVSMVASGIWYFGCALTTDHKTYCWGDGSFGQLGVVATDVGSSSATPVEIPLQW